jgi:nitrate reductase delta subunit
MANLYNALAILLRYPEEELRAGYCAAADMIEKDRRIRHGMKAKLRGLCEELTSGDILDVQARFVELFDRSRARSLNLYEHVHGESRDRGQAMVELLKLYSSHGLELNARELPDHLPIFLEFLSLLPPTEASTLLGEAAHVLEAMRERLKKRNSSYLAVFDALCAVAAAKADEQAVAALMSEPDTDSNDLAALDREWAEEPVSFGPGDAGCPKAAAMVAQMKEGAP